MRIQIEIDAVGVEVLEDVKQRTGLTTYKDIFNNGVTLLQWAIKQRVEGRVIASLDENTTNYKELTMPVLEDAARRSRVPA